jgi:hypothetical protein
MFKRVVSGRADPIRPIMLNGFHGLCRVTREIAVFVVSGASARLCKRVVFGSSLNGSRVLTGRVWYPFCQP